MRGEVIESGLLMQADLAYMTTFAALNSHAQTDVEKGAQQANTAYYDALANLPYMTGGLSGEDMVGKERQSAVEQYKKMKDALLEGREDNATNNQRPGTVETAAGRHLHRSRRK